MKKKVLFISESMGGGLRKHVVQLIENLDNNLFDIYFIHGTETLDESFKISYNQLKKKCSMYSCDTFCREINIKKDISSLKFIEDVIKSVKPDIVHCHSSKAGVLGRLAARKHGVKKIFYTPHAYSFLAPEFSNRKKYLFIVIERLLSKYATTMTFTVSEGEKIAALDNKIDVQKKFTVIYNGLPVNFQIDPYLKTELNISNDSFIVGNNARLTEQKNPILFLKIARKVIKQNKNIHFVWAGDGPLLNQAKTFINNFNLKNNIHLLGDRNDSELIVAEYDVFLTTSLYEGLPYAPIEAKRAGVPILASNVTGNNEILIDGETGFLFELDDINDASKKIEMIYGSEEGIEKNRILREFEQRFSMDTMLNLIINNYLS